MSVLNGGQTKEQCLNAPADCFQNCVTAASDAQITSWFNSYPNSRRLSPDDHDGVGKEFPNDGSKRSEMVDAYAADGSLLSIDGKEALVANFRGRYRENLKKFKESKDGKYSKSQEDGVPQRRKQVSILSFIE